ncbi:MAG TPA: M15 family metallopeptidase [Verrucomicrobiae bacterium]|jgi:hypothetical protein|nr:M15 family metallopeptidase [Verrucomicrobiae bacterium]
MRWLIGFVVLQLLIVPAARAEDVWNVLSDSEKATLDKVLAQWETWMPAKKADGTAPLVTFEDLYKGLSPEESGFLDRVRKINPKESFNFQGEYLGESREGFRMRQIEGQQVTKNGNKETLAPQYLPVEVFQAYDKMMAAMNQDLGRHLLVESGYRSPAYQLYTYLFYMPKHNYSLVETGHWVALPGYSEHGAPQLQAIDFINPYGVNGEDRVEDFEELPEYAWLQKHAGEYDFELSYPRDKPGITYEPWHWRYTGYSKVAPVGAEDIAESSGEAVAAPPADAAAAAPAEAAVTPPAETPAPAPSA